METGTKNKFMETAREKLFGYAKVTFELTAQLGMRLHVVPLRGRNGEFICASVTHRTLHCLNMLIVVSLSTHRLLVCVWEMEREFLGTRAFISLLALFLILGAWLVSFGINFRGETTAELLNAGPATMRTLTSTSSVGKSVSHYDDFIFSMGIIFTGFFGIILIPLTEVIASLVMPTIPVFVAPALKHWGLIPENDWSPLLLQILCSPLELFLGLLAGISGSFAAETLISTIGVIKIYLNDMEAFVMHKNGSLAVVEKQYIYMQLYNGVLIKWLKFAYPPILTSLCLCVIITSFVAIRHTELPTFIYANVTLAGITLATIIFALTIQGAMIRKSSARMVRLIQFYQTRQVQVTITEKHKYHKKRAKAFRLLSFPIGQFGEMSIVGANAIWEGLLNELIFLLSL